MDDRTNSILKCGLGPPLEETINNVKGSRLCILSKVVKTKLAFKPTKKGGQLVRVWGVKLSTNRFRSINRKQEIA